MSIGAAPNVAGGLLVGDVCVPPPPPPPNPCEQGNGPNAILPSPVQLLVCDPCNSCGCHTLLTDMQCCGLQTCPPPPGPYSNPVKVVDQVFAYVYERVPITLTRPDGTKETKNAACGNGVVFYSPQNLPGTYVYTTPQYVALNCTLGDTPQKISGSQANGGAVGGTLIYVVQIP